MSKSQKSVAEKVKQFFGKKETTPIDFDKLRKEPYVLSNEVLKDVGPESNLSLRLKTLKELYDIVQTKKLENYAVEAICKHIEDLLELRQSVETRHIVLQFYTVLVHGQLEQMNIMRTYLFRLIAQHNIPDDVLPRLEMLKALTQNGRDISYFEEEIGPFLLSWFPSIVVYGKASEFLPLVTNTIKFNAAYHDEEIVEGFIQNIHKLCSQARHEDDIQESLNVMEALLCYSHLPENILQSFICTLCQTVNTEKFSPCSWKQMRNLMGTNVGHTSIYKLCCILENNKSYENSVIRGGVFFISMALWGSHKVATLSHSPTTVLPSFLKALESKNDIVAYEIILALQRLVRKSGGDLTNLCWGMVFAILEKVIFYAEDKASSSVLSKAIHEFLTIAEENCPDSSCDCLYSIIEKCSESRSDQSVVKLILHHANKISPYKQDFVVNISKFMEKFYKNESRSVVQLEAIKVIKDLRHKSLYFFEDDLVDKAILQNLSHCDSSCDVRVRTAVMELLVEVLESCSSNWFFDVLDIVEKMLKNVFERLSQIETDEQFSDLVACIRGLILVFEKKLFSMPANHCVEIFGLLVSHLQQHYEKLYYFDDIVEVRESVLQLFLHLRANRQEQIGIYTTESTDYSLYILCESDTTKDTSEAPLSPPPGSPSSLNSTFSYLSFTKAYQLIINCLNHEKDWRVLQRVLQDLPCFLQNKSLIIRGNCSVTTLCSTLCKMINDRSYGMDDLKHAPSRLTRTEVQTRIFPCVAALTSYHSQLEPYMQRVLIKCLQNGLVSKSAKICTVGLTLCTLEMQNSMFKLLPDVLLKLSKISATVGVSVSVLEFLSYLIRLHNLYVSFVEDQYMSIFAIALPYTNPFKFNQFTVALAHHVIAMWFLKCRIPFRRDFAKFITKGLQSNLNILHEDSQSAIRSDDSQSSEDRPATKEMSQRAITVLHTELMETGLDLMARFTFGMSSNVPKRSPITDFLLEKGQKMSWLVGNKIVTITTSGCGTKSFRHGLCESCFSTCRKIDSSLDSDDNSSVFTGSQSSTFDREPESFSAKRKRHQSAIQRGNVYTHENLTGKQAKDDILLHFQRSPERSSQQYDEPNADKAIQSSKNEWPVENKVKDDKSGHLCSCWCTSWAEVHIRRPTGNTSWMTKIQNHLFLPAPLPDVPLPVLTSLILPEKEEDLESLIGSSHDSECLNIEDVEVVEGAIEINNCKKASPPMRRTNSSPDMNTGWSNFEALKNESNEDEVLESSPNSTKEEVELVNSEETELLTSSMELKEDCKPKHNLKLNLITAKRPENFKLRSSLRFESIDSAPISNSMYIKETQPITSAANAFRDRVHTISVMSPSRPSGTDSTTKGSEVNRRSGMSPSFVFLQLFHNSCFGPTTSKPLLLTHTETNNRALYVIDHIPPYDTHQIGVVFVGPGQCEDEVAILSNVYGSARYINFIRGLGNLVQLSEADPHTTFLGGLGTGGEDGKFTLVWHDDVMQVVFHVATLMTNKDSDKMRNEKKKHIGNDSVLIVYNESGKDFKLSTFKGQVTNAYVIVKPEDFNCNVVTVKHKTKELDDTFGHTEPYLVSDASLPLFVRQMALHANFASLIVSRKQSSSKYAHVSNWLERLRRIKNLRDKVSEELRNKNENSGLENSCDSTNFDDFTDYV